MGGIMRIYLNARLQPETNNIEELQVEHTFPNSEYWVTLLSVKGRTYQEARDKLRKLINSIKW